MGKLELFTRIVFVVVGLVGLTALSLLVSIVAAGAASTIKFWEQIALKRQKTKG